MDRKVELISFGGIETLRMAEFEPPTPADGEILIRQDAIGVNFIDIYQRTGLYPLPLPAVLGVEATGIVEAVGEAVHGLRVGDRIAYAGIPGGYATRRVLPGWRAVPLPDDIDAKAAAGGFLRALTAHMLLTRVFAAGPGKTLLVHAAAGGLGSILTRWARRSGCIVIGTAGSPDKAEIARANGADHVIVGRDADLVGETRRLTGGTGVDFAIDGIGGSMLARTLDCVRKFGTVASVGQAAGPIPPIRAEDLGPIRSIALARPSVMAYAAEPETYRAASEAVIGALRDGTIDGRIGREYRLEDAPRAQRDLETGATAGCSILVP